MRSIRTYLLTRLLGGTALVLAGAGLAVYVIVTRSLESQFDENLADRVQGFASILFQQEDQVEFEFSQELMPEYEPGAQASYFELWREDGRLIERSNSLRGRDLVIPRTPMSEPMHWSAPLPSDEGDESGARRGRFVAQLIEVHHLYPEEGPKRPTAAKVLVVVARGREELLAAQHRVLFYCAALSLALMGLIALLCWIAVKKGLAPTVRLAKTLDAIEVERLPEHLEVGPLPRELEPMAQTADALLRRLDAAFARERRTTADIAHELRTPISEMLIVSEVALRDVRDADGMRRALATVRDVAMRMGRSVSTLLKLARLDMGAETFDREDVDLGRIVRELLRSLSAVERERGLRLDNLVDVGERVEADADVLRIVVSNLLSNALHYTPPRGSVACRLDRQPDQWRFVVENAAADLRPEDLRTLTEAFWRKDRSRSDSDRSGLGLALSQALAEKAGMQLAFELEGGTLRAILTGPSASNGHERSESVDRLAATPSGTRDAG